MQLPPHELPDILPGLAVWGDYIASKTFGADGVLTSGIDFTDLQGFREVRLVGMALTHADGSSQDVLVRLSDETSTWAYDSSGYTNSGAVGAGTNGFPLFMGLAAALPISFLLDFFDFNVSNRPTKVRALSGRDGSGAGVLNYFARFDTARVDTALRIIIGAGVDQTDYGVYIYGRE